MADMYEQISTHLICAGFEVPPYWWWAAAIAIYAAAVLCGQIIIMWCIEIKMSYYCAPNKEIFCHIARMKHDGRLADIYARQAAWRWKWGGDAWIDLVPPNFGRFKSIFAIAALWAFILAYCAAACMSGGSQNKWRYALSFAWPHIYAITSIMAKMISQEYVNSINVLMRVIFKWAISIIELHM